MSKKEMFFFVGATLFLAFLLWLMKDAFGGWSELALVFGAFGVIMFIMGIVMISIMGIIYWATVYRSRNYARKLRDAGYAVWLHTDAVWQFAILALISFTFAPMTLWLTHRVYSVYDCIQRGECYDKPTEWYVIAPIIIIMFWAITLFGIFGTINIWRQSFRPLRRYYNDMQLGRSPDLPRIR